MHNYLKIRKARAIFYKNRKHVNAQGEMVYMLEEDVQSSKEKCPRVVSSSRNRT